MHDANLRRAIVDESARHKARAVASDERHRAMGYWDVSGVNRIEGMFQRVQLGRAGRGLAVLTRVVFKRFLNQITKSQPRSAYLRLRISLRALTDLCNLAVFVSFNIMKNEHCSVSGRQFLDVRLKSDAIDNAVESQVRTSKFLGQSVELFVAVRDCFQRSLCYHLPAKTHQNDVDGHAMQPCGKS